MFQCANSEFIASIKGSSHSLRIYVCEGQKGLVIIIKTMSTGFSKTSVCSEVAWQVGSRGILETRKTEVCLNSHFQMQHEFWPLNFLTSVRN